MRLWLVVMVASWLVGCSAADCEKSCDGCCNKGLCVPLAATSRTQCGRGGAQCLNSCPVCEQGFCSTGFECLLFRPQVCECGSRGTSLCGFDCGQCAAGKICQDFRCEVPDAGAADAGEGDAGP